MLEGGVGLKGKGLGESGIQGEGPRKDEDPEVGAHLPILHGLAPKPSSLPLELPMPGLGARHWTLTGPPSSPRFDMSTVCPNRKKLSTCTGAPHSKLYSVELVSLASSADSPMWSGHCPPSPIEWQMN